MRNRLGPGLYTASNPTYNFNYSRAGVTRGPGAAEQAFGFYERSADGTVVLLGVPNRARGTILASADQLRRCGQRRRRSCSACYGWTLPR